MMSETQTTTEAQAESFKNDANKLFADKHYEEAIELYSKAIELNPKVPSYFTNRAFAYIRTESFGLAKNDADTALQLDPTFAKAYYRRATANMSMMKFKLALKDLKTLMKYAPNDLDAREKFAECQKIVRRIEFEKAIEMDEETPKKGIEQLGDIDSIVVEPSYTGPHLPETGPSTEFVIELMEHFKKEKSLHRKYAYKIIVAAKALFTSYESLVNVSVPPHGTITVCGDTHGQFYDLYNIFQLNGYPSETNAYLFNGDFVDRGSFSVEVMFTLLAWKLALPHHFYLARGNHESLEMNRVYGFEGEVQSKFGRPMFLAFTDLFNAFPLAHVIANQIFVVHGGLCSKDNVTLDEIRQIDRFQQPDDNELMRDLLWSDPCDALGKLPSKRGLGFQFGPDITERFLSQNKLTKLIRSHELKSEGYEIAHNGKCITIFSAPNYCDAMGNKGAIIVIDEDLNFTYKQFTAVDHPNVQPMQFSPLRGF